MLISDVTPTIIMIVNEMGKDISTKVVAIASFLATIEISLKCFPSFIDAMFSAVVRAMM